MAAQTPVGISASETSASRTSDFPFSRSRGHTHRANNVVPWQTWARIFPFSLFCFPIPFFAGSGAQKHITPLSPHLGSRPPLLWGCQSKFAVMRTAEKANVQWQVKGREQKRLSIPEVQTCKWVYTIFGCCLERENWLFQVKCDVWKRIFMWEILNMKKLSCVVE